MTGKYSTSEERERADKTETKTSWRLCDDKLVLVLKADSSDLIKTTDLTTER